MKDSSKRLEGRILDLKDENCEVPISIKTKNYLISLGINSFDEIEKTDELTLAKLGMPPKYFNEIRAACKKYGLKLPMEDWTKPDATSDLQY